jgi:hypothetical protein
LILGVEIETALMARRFARLIAPSASAWLNDAGVGNVDATSPTQRVDNVARLIDRARVSAMPDGN